MSDNSITNELTGKSGIQTDHGGIGIGDIIVLLLDAVLLIYTAWRSYDFLTTTVPDGFQILALIGLWGLDIGAIAWSLVWIFGSTAKFQDWTAMSFWIIDLVGVFLTSITDSLMYGAKDGALTTTLMSIAMVAIPLVVFGNVLAGFIFHMTSPATKARRSARKALAEHNAKMDEISAMERDLIYAESYLLAKQETLDKSVLLADMKTAQDAIEKATRAKLRDQIGIHNAANGITSNGETDKLAALKTHLAALRDQVKALGAELAPADAPASAPAPAPVSASAPASAPAPVPFVREEPSYHPLGVSSEAQAPAIINPIPEPVLANGNGNGHQPQDPS
jgi:hypothetical protein